MNNLPLVVVIGAGPAGLTAARELTRHDKFRILILEATGEIGGISKTVNYKGNRIDIGGHRFFSKSDWVLNWWQAEMPVFGDTSGEVPITYQNKTHNMRPVAGQSERPEDSLLIATVCRASTIRGSSSLTP